MQQIFLFPTILSASTYPDHAAGNRIFAARIRSLIKERATQTHDRLHEDPAFTPLVEFIIGKVSERFDYFKYTQRDFFITSCWANLHRRGEGIATHRHPNSFLSGVYYVETQKESGKLIFRDPRKAELVFDVLTSEKTAWNCPQFEVRPVEGHLLLFPSWLEHDVERSWTDGERISVSFNVMLQGDLGSPDHLTRLTI
ncbi:MAG: 2OG-Fe(II) oxygenase family protein [Proteobacteria bacterium]|nr:2OG-Fe(II) oxygenase family protein [Pseudomonadota bacterium]